MHEQFHSRVLTRLRSLGRRLRLYLFVDGLAVLCAALLIAVFATLLIDRTFWLAWDKRVTQLISLLAVLAIIAWRFIWRPLQAPLLDEHLAILVEKRFPQLESKLVSAVEFARPAPSDRHRSSAMMRSVITQADEAAADLHFSDTLAHDRFRRSGMVAMGCVLLMTASSLVAGSTMGLWFRRNVLLREEAWPQNNRLMVEGLADGKLVVPRGDDLTIAAVVEAGYLPPRQVFISYSGGSGLKGRDQMPRVTGETIRFEHTFERIQETLTCRITGGDATPQEFMIEVLERPQVSQVTIGIEPPAYTRLDRYELRTGQTVAEALPGSRLQFHVLTSKPVRQAELMRESGGDAVPVGEVRQVSASEFVGFDSPAASGTYHFRLVDEAGLSNISERIAPVRFTVRLVADKPPKVTLRVKGAGEMVTREAVLPVETDFTDQYGLASAALVHQISREDAKPISEPMPGFEAGTKTFAHQMNWPVAPHNVKEGDRLTLQAEASDSDDVSGPNIGKSSPIVFRVVSREELLAELNRREQEYRQDFERMIRMQEELYAALLTQAQNPQADAAQQSRMFRQLSRQQRDQAGRMNTLRLQFDQVLSELRINQLADVVVEERLGNGIVRPLEQLSRLTAAQAAEALDRLAQDNSAASVQAGRETQEQVIREMNAVLANMLKWERFQEAVSLLREVLKMQGNVSQETEKALEGRIFGTESAPVPSKP